MFYRDPSQLSLLWENSNKSTSNKCLLQHKDKLVAKPCHPHIEMRIRRAHSSFVHLSLSYRLTELWRNWVFRRENARPQVYDIEAPSISGWRNNDHETHLRERERESEWRNNDNGQRNSPVVNNCVECSLRLILSLQVLAIVSLCTFVASSAE